jgi:hypothetical protein
MSGKKVKDLIITVFVEGESEEVFYKRLLPHLKGDNKTKCLVRNVRGVGNYNRKAQAILKNDILKKHPKNNHIVFCAYDNDVFRSKLRQKPPIDWNKVEKGLIAVGATEVNHIIAKEMIEDWFLSDIEGICTKVLKIKPPKALKGNDAEDKMKKVFRMGKKVYTKGYNVGKFIDKLDLSKIAAKQEKDLATLKEKLS